MRESAGATGRRRESLSLANPVKLGAPPALCGRVEQICTEAARGRPTKATELLKGEAIADPTTARRPQKEDATYGISLSKLLTMGEGKQPKRYQAVDKINALEPEFQALSGCGSWPLRRKSSASATPPARAWTICSPRPSPPCARLPAHHRASPLRRAAHRRHGPNGQIAEMKTGEGKTLVSTLAGYLNAIPGHNAHRDRQRLSGPDMTASGWARSTASSA